MKLPEISETSLPIARLLYSFCYFTNIKLIKDLWNTMFIHVVCNIHLFWALILDIETESQIICNIIQLCSIKIATAKWNHQLVKNTFFPFHDCNRINYFICYYPFSLHWFILYNPQSTQQLAGWLVYNMTIFLKWMTFLKRHGRVFLRQPCVCVCIII